MLLRVFLLSLLLCSTKTVANIYFGFDVGGETVSQAAARLQLSGAKLKVVRYRHYHNLLAGVSTADDSYKRKHALGLIDNIILTFITTPGSDLNAEVGVRKIHSVSVYIDGDEDIGDRVHRLLTKKYGQGEEVRGNSYRWKTSSTYISMQYMGAFGGHTVILEYTDVDLDNELRMALQENKRKEKIEKNKKDTRMMEDL